VAGPASQSTSANASASRRCRLRQAARPSVGPESWQSGVQDISELIGVKVEKPAPLPKTKTPKPKADGFTFG